MAATAKALRNRAFIRGASRIVDFHSAFYDKGALIREIRSKSSQESDAKKIYADWVKIGADMKRAMQQFEAENQ